MRVKFSGSQCSRWLYYFFFCLTLRKRGIKRRQLARGSSRRDGFADSNRRDDRRTPQDAEVAPLQFANYDGARGDIKDDSNWASNAGAEWFPWLSPSACRSRAVAYEWLCNSRPEILNWRLIISIVTVGGNMTKSGNVARNSKFDFPRCQVFRSLVKPHCYDAVISSRMAV